MAESEPLSRSGTVIAWNREEEMVGIARAEKAELADLLQEQFRCLPQVDSSMVYGRTHV